MSKRDKRKHDPKNSAVKYKLESQYGITVEQYNQMLENQNYCCAICGTEPVNRRLSVDHDHITGQVRGLLCPKCNMGLGCFRDEIPRLERASQYLHSDGSHVFTTPLHHVMPDAILRKLEIHEPETTREYFTRVIKESQHEMSTL